jgi:hypothetical protein
MTKQTTVAVVPETQVAEVDVANEIVRLHREVEVCVRLGLSKALRIGDLLTEQKSRLGHGQFISWVKTNLPFTDRTARNYMALWKRRELLKTETVSVLSAAYKLLASHSEDKKQAERPWELYFELKGKLLVANELVQNINKTDVFDTQENSHFFALFDECVSSARGFFGVVDGYLAAIEASGDTSLKIRELGWVAGIALVIQNAFAEIHIMCEIRLGQFLNSLPVDVLEFLKVNNFSAEALNALKEATEVRIRELETEQGIPHDS